MLFLISGVGLYGLRKFRSTHSWRMVVIGLIGLIVLSWPPVTKLTSLPFVAPYIKQLDPTANPEAIVVLAGAVNPPTKFRPYVIVGQDTYKRVMQAVWYFRSRRAQPIVVTGGPEPGVSEPASAARRMLLEHEGVPPQ